MQNRCEFTLTDCINVLHGEITPQTDAILRLGGVSSSGRHIKCPNVKANPLLSPTPFVLASQAPRRDFTRGFTILVVWSGAGGEKWQFWVENGKEIVEQMIFATFRQLRAAAADKGQSG